MNVHTFNAYRFPDASVTIMLKKSSSGSSPGSGIQFSNSSHSSNPMPWLITTPFPRGAPVFNLRNLRNLCSLLNETKITQMSQI